MTSIVRGATATAPEAFVDLICQDDEWVRLEFDELVAGLSGTPPQPPRPAPPRPAPPPFWAVGAVADDVPGPASGPVPAWRWSRQRSPPVGRCRKGR